MTPLTEDGRVLTDLVLATFRLNGCFLEAAERIARPVGLTAARWQVMGAILDEPRPVAGIACVMGLARQSVQRLADILVGEGLARFEPNPRHKRAKLLAMTPQGREAIGRLAEDQHRWANGVAGVLAPGELAACLDAMRRIIGRVEGQSDED